MWHSACIRGTIASPFPVPKNRKNRTHRQELVCSPAATPRVRSPGNHSAVPIRSSHPQLPSFSFRKKRLPPKKRSRHERSSLSRPNFDTDPLCISPPLAHSPPPPSPSYPPSQSSCSRLPLPPSPPPLQLYHSTSWTILPPRAAAEIIAWPPARSRSSPRPIIRPPRRPSNLSALASLNLRSTATHPPHPRTSDLSKPGGGLAYPVRSVRGLPYCPMDRNLAMGSNPPIAPALRTWCPRRTARHTTPPPVPTRRGARNTISPTATYLGETRQRKRNRTLQLSRTVLAASLR
jgi:hypothetical protein